MIVTKLFELFMFRKMVILILLVVFNIAAFFAYDLAAKNNQLLLKMQFPISEEGKQIVNIPYFFDKYSTSSVMSDVISGVDKTSYKIKRISEGNSLDLSVSCEIKENCLTASKLLIDALNNEAKINNDAKAYDMGVKIYELKVLSIKDEINSLNNERKSYLNKIESYANKRDVLTSTTEEYFQISEENINEANNPNNLQTILLLESLNNQRQLASRDVADVSVDSAEISIDLAVIESMISQAKMKLKAYSELNEVKHLFIWVVEPSFGDIEREVSFSLWLALSFLLSIALYFLAAVMINSKQN